MTQLLDTRTYTLTDQTWFAALAGDWNPMHVDPVAARRALFGEAVVHGMHTALRALDAFLTVCGATRVCVTRIRGTFPNAIPLGRAVETRLFEHETAHGTGRARLDVRIGGQLAAQLRVEYDSGPDRAPIDDALLPPADSTRSAGCLEFSALDGRTGTLAPWIDRAAAEEAFPALIAVAGSGLAARLLSLTRLVGMECPGLNSIFSTFDLRLDTNVAGPLTWAVTRATAAISFVRMKLAGAGQSGRVDAFYRPPPRRQAGMDIVRSRVPADAYIGWVALVVGGSRGLGEATARIVAAGGGHAILTYHRGQLDAETLRDEIRAAGGSCDAIACDVTDEDGTRRAIEQLASAPTHLLYFASPKILKRGSVRRADEYDDDLEAWFTRFYVTGFEACCRAALSRGTGPLDAFYPSTIVLDEPDETMKEYCAAKQVGEDVCTRLAVEEPRLSVLVRRLPAVATDQMAALMSVSVDARDALDVMLEVLSRLPTRSR